MTLETTSRKHSWPGDDTTGPFTFTIPFFSEDHLVFKRDDGTGTLTVEEPASITSIDNGTSGGEVTLDTALATGETLYLFRTVPYTQENDLRENGGYSADTHEEALDLLTMQTQQISDQLARGVFVSETEDSITSDIPDAATRANKALVFDNTGEIVTVSDIEVGSFSDIVTSASGYADAASASATAASGYATTASGHATNASASADAAAASAADAAIYVWGTPEAWVTSTAYVIQDVCTNGGSTYFCLEAHTSGTFATDLAAGKWILIAQKGADGAGTVASVVAGDGMYVDSADATNPIVHIVDDGIHTVLLQDGCVTNAKLDDMAANTVKANATTGAAAPGNIALAASQLLGRGSTGNIAAIGLGGGLSMSGTTLSASGTFTKSYTSSWTAITATTSTNFSHGLGEAPKMAYVEFKCVSAAVGYSVGDIITNIMGFSLVGTYVRLSGVELVYSGTTTITALVGFYDYPYLLVVNKSSLGVENSPIGNWNYRVVAFA